MLLMASASNRASKISSLTCHGCFPGMGLCCSHQGLKEPQAQPQPQRGGSGSLGLPLRPGLGLLTESVKFKGGVSHSHVFHRLQAPPGPHCQ